MRGCLRAWLLFPTIYITLLPDLRAVAALLALAAWLVEAPLAAAAARSVAVRRVLFADMYAAAISGDAPRVYWVVGGRIAGHCEQGQWRMRFPFRRLRFEGDPMTRFKL